jgi:hypothetical protein
MKNQVRNGGGSRFRQALCDGRDGARYIATLKGEAIVSYRRFRSRAVGSRMLRLRLVFRTPTFRPA